MTASNPSNKDLLEFLTAAELQHYHNKFVTTLKVNSVTQLKYVDDDDLLSIDMSRPEIKRLRQHFKKESHMGALTKIKKILSKSGQEQSSQSQTTISISPPINLCSASPMKHIIAEESVMLLNVIGRGEFGCVQQGVWTKDSGEKVQVAIKCLPKDQVKGQTSEFLQEATIMHSICHPHIIKLHGIVLGEDSYMMVTELAPLKSLLECLKDASMQTTFTLQHLYNLVTQLADAMMYLEKNRLVHRDLAARNVLMFAKDKVKISDFGLSKALGVGSDYYQGHLNTGLKLPIAWCAPECINFLRFTTSSDVWSFGVLLWEMFSGGGQPWEGMTGLEIMELVDAPSLKRLPCPLRCSDEMYSLMLQCWAHEPTERPKFQDIHSTISKMKAMQVIMLKDTPVDGQMNEEFLRYKSQSIITVLSKNPPYPPQPNMWRGLMETSSNITAGFFDPRCSSPYIEVVPSNQLLRKIKLNRTESARLSMRNQYKMTPSLISYPQNDFRVVTHVGTDGEMYGDVSFIGNNLDKLPLKASSAHRSEDDLRSPRTSLPMHKILGPGKQSGFSLSSSTLMNTTREQQHDEFDDFSLPNFSSDFDSGSSLMDEVLKMLSTTSTVTEDDEMKGLLAGFENLGLSVYLNQNGANGKNEGGGNVDDGNQVGATGGSCLNVDPPYNVKVGGPELKSGYKEGGGGGGSNQRLNRRLQNVLKDEDDDHIRTNTPSNGYNNTNNTNNNNINNNNTNNNNISTAASMISPHMNKYNKPINTSSPNSLNSNNSNRDASRSVTEGYNANSPNNNNINNSNINNNNNNSRSPVHDKHDEHDDDVDDVREDEHDRDSNADDVDVGDDVDVEDEGSMFESSSTSSNRDLNGHYNGLDDDKKSKISTSSTERQHHHHSHLQQQQQQQQQRSQNENNNVTSTASIQLNKNLSSYSPSSSNSQASSYDNRQPGSSSPGRTDPSNRVQSQLSSENMSGTSTDQQDQQRSSLRTVNLGGVSRSSTSSSSSAQQPSSMPSFIPSSTASRNQNLRAPIIPGRPAPLASTDDDVDSASLDTNPLRRLRQSAGTRPMMTFRTANSTR